MVPNLGRNGGHPWHRLEGSWTISGSHRLMPDEPITGTATFEWLEDQRFLLARWHFDHPKIPDAIAVIGEVDGKQTKHYFDVRGVHRVFDVGIDERSWWYANQAQGFSQRFTGKFSADGQVIEGVVDLRTDGVTWERDLWIEYRRA